MIEKMEWVTALVVCVILTFVVGMFALLSSRETPPASSSSRSWIQGVEVDPTAAALIAWQSDSYHPIVKPDGGFINNGDDAFPVGSGRLVVGAGCVRVEQEVNSEKNLSVRCFRQDGSLFEFTIYADPADGCVKFRWP